MITSQSIKVIIFCQTASNIPATKIKMQRNNIHILPSTESINEHNIKHSHFTTTQNDHFL